MTEPDDFLVSFDNTGAALRFINALNSIPDGNGISLRVLNAESIEKRYETVLKLIAAQNCNETKEWEAGVKFMQEIANKVLKELGHD